VPGPKVASYLCSYFLPKPTGLASFPNSIVSLLYYPGSGRTSGGLTLVRPGLPMEAALVLGLVSLSAAEAS